MSELPIITQQMDSSIPTIKIEQLDNQALVNIQQYSLNPAGYQGEHTAGYQQEHPTTTKEKERIAGRLSGFNPKDNMVWHEITQRFGASIKQPELLSIASVLATNAGIKLDRDAKRRKSVLIKWFEENWASIKPFLDYVVLEESHPN